MVVIERDGWDFAQTGKMTFGTPIDPRSTDLSRYNWCQPENGFDNMCTGGAIFQVVTWVL